MKKMKNEKQKKCFKNVLENKCKWRKILFLQIICKNFAKMYNLDEADVLKTGIKEYVKNNNNW